MIWNSGGSFRVFGDFKKIPDDFWGIPKDFQ